MKKTILLLSAIASFAIPASSYAMRAALNCDQQLGKDECDCDTVHMIESMRCAIVEPFGSGPDSCQYRADQAHTACYAGAFARYEACLARTMPDLKQTVE